MSFYIKTKCHWAGANRSVSMKQIGEGSEVTDEGSVKMHIRYQFDFDSPHAITMDFRSIRFLTYNGWKNGVIDWNVSQKNEKTIVVDALESASLAPMADHEIDQLDYEVALGLLGHARMQVEIGDVVIEDGEDSQNGKYLIVGRVIETDEGNDKIQVQQKWQLFKSGNKYPAKATSSTERSYFARDMRERITTHDEILSQLI